jgi:hypothetical protein
MLARWEDAGLLCLGVARLADVGDGDGGDPGTAAEGARVAGIEGGDGIEVVLVDEIDELAEARAEDDDVNRGKRQGQPLGGSVRQVSVRQLKPT